MRLARVFLVIGLCGAGASVSPAGAQPVPPSPPDISVSNLRLNGELNPGGRAQFEATITSTGKFPKGERQLTFAFQICRGQGQGACTSVVAGTTTYLPGTVTQLRTDWKAMTPWLPKEGQPPTHVMVFARDQTVQEDFANNEQWMPVSVGVLPQAPYGYVKFNDREIDKKNHAKLTKVSRDACLLACSADTFCKSVDYAPSTKTCYTQHFHRKEVGGAYKKSSKYDHYARPCRLDESAKSCST